jgi:hypothetical protein
MIIFNHFLGLVMTYLSFTSPIPTDTEIYSFYRYLSYLGHK